MTLNCCAVYESNSFLLASKPTFNVQLSRPSHSLGRVITKVMLRLGPSQSECIAGYLDPGSYSSCDYGSGVRLLLNVIDIYVHLSMPIPCIFCIMCISRTLRRTEGETQWFGRPGPSSNRSRRISANICGVTAGLPYHEPSSARLVQVLVHVIFWNLR